jgi:hypothetical protein
MREISVDPALRDRRSRKWKRWERGAPMELWQMDVVGGFPLDRWQLREGADRYRRPLAVLRVGASDGP